ncbi:phospholipase A-2-activating protein [Coniophora puteana RWD-64-598 SS2]|uniref:Phospholipase A-2-activating protein n=1 Tax=Coniophora puteana (strain RWD-64-598) TaxID=741705 RepID=A0A5M3N0S1_CONPW|nr:phospholipase A-2-activating protein [Coniophora puteana RWD-64-598 SS2]EIW84876.1 phospholipase A-2-activating protein [Coniophora puteana RWD-64-598 SS2]
MPYKLSATLSGHSSDVRAITSPTNSIILSASRDTTAVSWVRSSPSTPFNQASVLRAGSRFVNSVGYIHPSIDAPQGYAVTGGQDMVLNIFPLDGADKDDPTYSLVGHTANICAIHVSPQGTIISGSWDKTAKVWSQFQLQYDLQGHTEAVWAVLATDEDRFLTASADKTIRLWQQHKTVRTFQGHKDVVRGLAWMPDIGFASCSNDSEIIVWTFEGDIVYTLSGHTSFVYSLSVLHTGDVVSSGEDRSVRVWKDGECSQTIVHPATSVWAVATMPNGDIVSGSSDGVVRVFSEAEERWASAEELKAYGDQVASQALPVQQVGDVKKSDLPGPEALSEPGNKDGQVKMVRNGDLVEAHQWDGMARQWQKVGDVVDAVGSGRKQIYQGKEYDYVFDVDIKDGVPPLKLPYNANENPYTAANRFLEQNDLPLSYIDEVANFIQKNASGTTLGSNNNDYVDPFTGASRYQAQSNSASTGPSSQYMDPFTGASRYSGAPQQAFQPSSEYMDPFTGASRYSGSPQTSTPTPQAARATAIIPCVDSISFKQANVSAMQTKLYQFDEALKNEISTSSLAMYPDELEKIDEAFALLTQVTNGTKTGVPPLTGQHIEAIIPILDRWPSSQRFPVMDLSRLLAAYCAAASAAPGEREQFFACLFKASDWSTIASVRAPMPKPQETNVLLLLRTLANCFMDGTPINEGQWANQVLEALTQAPLGVFNKAQRTCYATILLNFSCAYLKIPIDSSVRSKHVELTLQVLRSEKEDQEVAYRTLVALGNMVYGAKSHRAPLDTTQSNGAKQIIAALPSTFADARIKNVASEVAQLL